MSKLDLLKQEYISEKASDNLKERVDRIMKKEKKKPIIKWCAGIAAGLVVAAVAAVNISPTLAYALSSVPGVSSIVKVATLGRYVKEEGGYSASVTTPQISGLADKELEERLNKEFKENADAVIAAYEKDVKALKAEYGEDTIHMGVDMDYIIKTDNEDYLAIDVYLLNIAGSSSTKHTFYTIDKHTNKLLTLEGLFKKNADYVTPISEYIKQEMIRRNTEEEGYFWVEDDEYTEGFRKIAKNQNFYIDPSGSLVICFDKYEVAAGAQGSPEFVIPNEVIADILR